MGRSLGGAVAVALAAEEGARALVLENAFPTMPDVAALHYPWLPVRWVMNNRYDSLIADQAVQRPTAPKPRHRRRTGPIEPRPGGCSTRRRARDKKWIEFPDLGHNERLAASYYDDLAAFLGRVDNHFRRCSRPPTCEMSAIPRLLSSGRNSSDFAGRQVC